MKIKVAILDSDYDYLRKISRVIENSYTDKVQLFTFTNKEYAYQGIRGNKIDVFLAAQDFDIDQKSLSARCVFAYFTDSVEVKYYKDKRCIGKYQKVEFIYKEILSIYADNAMETGERFADSAFNSKIYTFLSPAGGTGSSTLAQAYAISRIKRGIKTLYINLEQFSDVSSVFQGNGIGDLSEIFYSIKSKKNNIRLKIESSVKTSIEGVNYFDSCVTPFDFYELTKDEVKSFVDNISGSDMFDCIVLDCDFNFSENMSEVLANSKKIVLVDNGTSVSNQKTRKAVAAFDIFEQQKDMNLIS